MNLITAGLHKNTFRMHGKPLTYVSYRSHRAALDFLRNTYSQDTGPGVLAGPPMIGKTTVVRNFVRGLPANTAVAAVDCQNLVSGGLLNAVLTQFGFLLDRLNENEKLKLLNVFLDRQTAIFHPSLLLIENAHELRPSEYQALQQMFEARYKGRSTLRVILIGDSSLGLVIDALRAHNVLRRAPNIFVLQPMTATETEQYVYSKLRAGGYHCPEAIVSSRLCEELFEKSEGYPGLIDWLVLLRLNQAEKLPLLARHEVDPIPENLPLLSIEDMVSVSEVAADPAEVPELHFTLDGKTTQQVKLTRATLVIGRAEGNDVTIVSPAISRHHALLIRQNNATLLIDLHSTNGVLVNSRRVTSRVLRHNDIISLGNHRIKVFDPHSRDRVATNAPTLDDTTTTPVLGDVRRLVAVKHTHEVQRATSR